MRKITFEINEHPGKRIVTLRGRRGVDVDLQVRPNHIRWERDGQPVDIEVPYVVIILPKDTAYQLDRMDYTSRQCCGIQVEVLSDHRTEISGYVSNGFLIYLYQLEEQALLKMTQLWRPDEANREGHCPMYINARGPWQLIYNLGSLLAEWHYDRKHKTKRIGDRS